MSARLVGEASPFAAKPALGALCHAHERQLECTGCAWRHVTSRDTEYVCAACLTFDEVVVVDASGGGVAGLARRDVQADSAAARHLLLQCNDRVLLPQILGSGFEPPKT